MELARVEAQEAVTQFILMAAVVVQPQVMVVLPVVVEAELLLGRTVLVQLVLQPAIHQVAQVVPLVLVLVRAAMVATMAWLVMLPGADRVAEAEVEELGRIMVAPGLLVRSALLTHPLLL